MLATATESWKSLNVKFSEKVFGPFRDGAMGAEGVKAAPCLKKKDKSENVGSFYASRIGG